MGTTWSIARRRGTCARSERPFEDGERHVSMLEVHEGTLERVDLSLDAWKAHRAEIEDARHDAREPIYYWFTRHQVEKKKTVQLDMESLDALFVSLEGREELAVRELRYVLCLLLMRKRRAKVEKVMRQNDEESFIVKRPKDETRYQVFVYDFENERLDEVRAQLQAVFDGAEGPHGIRLGDGDDDELDGDRGEVPAAEAVVASDDEAPAAEPAG